MQKVNDIRNRFRELLEAQEFVIDKSGVKTLEIIGASFIADEPTIFGTLNLDYANREIEWYKSMSLYVKDIPGKVPAIWQNVASKHGEINSNYGWCIWSKANGLQYKYCLQELICNTESRRAIMIYTRPTMHTDFYRDGMSDFMCTNAVQYVIRNGRIHAIVQMRSNDVVHGFKNDRFWQLHVLTKLVTDYNTLTESKLQVGDIHWNVGSLHVYERHFELVKSNYNSVIG
jgi:thymidylate synthase